MAETARHTHRRVAQHVLQLLLTLCALLPMACEKVDLPATPSSTGGGSTTPTIPTDPVVGTGQGSLTAPFTVAQVHEQGTALYGSYVWVVGYVVGHTSYSIQNAVFSAEGAVRSNVLLADSPFETDVARCLPVELKREDCKLGISLADNPGLWSHYLRVNGTVEAYFRTTGLRDVDNYTWLGLGPYDRTENGGETDPPAPETPDTPDSGEETLPWQPDGGVIDGGRIAPRETFRMCP